MIGARPAGSAKDHPPFFAIAAPAAPAKARLDIAVIERTLRQTQSDFPTINERLRVRRENLDRDMVRNMVEGYRFVDRLVSQGTDIFAMGNLHFILELNSCVLFGSDETLRRRHADHLQATNEHFYEEAEAGIRDVVEWYSGNRQECAWNRAAGVYIRMLSMPQLFLEGNHRTGVLLMSYVLLSENEPPFILTNANAKAFLDQSARIKTLRKRSLAMRLQMSRLKRTFAAYLKESADRDLLAAV